MKQIFIILFSLITLASCRYTTGSGNLVSETRPAGNFNGINVGGGFIVEVKIGPVTSVVVEADDNIIKYIETSTSGNTLKIRTEDLHNYSDVHMKVYITTPSLKKLSASASAEVEVLDVLTGTDRLIFKSSSGADIVAEVDAPEIESDVSSGASITLRGKTKSYSAEGSSGAEIRSWNLLSESTSVNVSSGSSAKVHASVRLDIKASSGATVTYHGAAEPNNTISSGASIVRKD